MEKIYMSKAMSEAMKSLAKMNINKPFFSSNNATYGYMERGTRRFMESLLVGSKTTSDAYTNYTLIRGVLYGLSFQNVVTYDQEAELFRLYDMAYRKVRHRIIKAERKSGRK